MRSAFFNVKCDGPDFVSLNNFRLSKVMHMQREYHTLVTERPLRPLQHCSCTPSPRRPSPPVSCSPQCRLLSHSLPFPHPAITQQCHSVVRNKTYLAADDFADLCQPALSIQHFPPQHLFRQEVYMRDFARVCIGAENVDCLR